MGCVTIFKSSFSVLFEYNTPKLVQIKSKRVGVINRLIQLTIIGYIIGYAILWKKGYLAFDDVESAVITKVRGVAFVNQSKYPEITNPVWDVAEYLIPPQENSAFFVITNLLETPHQRVGVCNEDPGEPNATCSKDSDCPTDDVLPRGNGLLTGKCNTTAGLCLINAWCPVEDSRRKPPETPALLRSKDFRVFIKNTIQFPKFGVKRRNMPDDASRGFFQTCLYSTHSIDCPIFRLETIVNDAGIDYLDIARNGGVIQIKIYWNCNLDHSEDECVPKYSFKRLDRKKYKISTGYDVRYAKHYIDVNGTEFRTLYTASGIKFIVSVMGQAGKFSTAKLFTTIGSGISYLVVATICCDIIVLYLFEKKDECRHNIFTEVIGSDAYSPHDNYSQMGPIQLANIQQDEARPREPLQEETNDGHM